MFWWADLSVKEGAESVCKDEVNRMKEFWAHYEPIAHLLFNIKLGREVLESKKIYTKIAELKILSSQGQAASYVWGPSLCRATRTYMARFLRGELIDIAQKREVFTMQKKADLIKKVKAREAELDMSVVKGPQKMLITYRRKKAEHEGSWAYEKDHTLFGACVFIPMRFACKCEMTSS